MKKRKLHLITSLFITGIITLVISFNLNSHKEARKTNIILANIEALANMEWAQENLTTACRPCIQWEVGESLFIVIMAKAAVTIQPALMVIAFD